MTASSTVMVDGTGYLVVGLECAKPGGCGSGRRKPKPLACKNSLGRVRQRLAGPVCLVLARGQRTQKGEMGLWWLRLSSLVSLDTLNSWK